MSSVTQVSKCVAISHPNFFRGLFEAVVPEAIVNPLPH